MFEAYKVGVTLSVANKVSGVLAVIASDFAKTDKSAKALLGTLVKMKAAQLGMAGMLVGGAGFVGLRLVEGAVKPANEYVSQLNRMNVAGMTQLEIAQSIRDAWRNTSDVITTTATGNLKTILDLRNVLGGNKGMDEIEALLPVVSKIQAVMAASSDTRLSQHADDLAFGMAKALDIIGAVRDPAEMNRQAEMMAKAIEFSQGRVTPQMFQSAFQYARQAKFDLTDEFKYEVLPSLLLEFANKGGGGGSRGVGPMLSAFYRFTNQGYVNKAALPELQKLGLVDAGDALKTTTTGTTLGHGVAGALLAAQNPYQWVNQVLVPAIQRVYPNATDDFIRSEINMLMRGNQLAASMAVEFYSKQGNFARDQALTRGALPYEEAYINSLANNPYTAMAALGAQWDNFKTALGVGLVPVLIPFLRNLASAFNTLGRFAQAHPTLAQGLMLTFTGLSLLATIGGGVMIAGAGLKLLSVPPGLLTGLDLAGLATGIGGITVALGPLGIAIAAFAAILYRKEITDFIDKYAAQPVANAIDKRAPWASDALMRARDWLSGGDDLSYTNRSFAPPHSNSQTIQVNSTVNLDGRPIAQAVTQHQYDAADGPATGPNSADNRQLFLQSGY